MRSTIRSTIRSTVRSTVRSTLLGRQSEAAALEAFVNHGGLVKIVGAEGVGITQQIQQAREETVGHHEAFDLLHAGATGQSHKMLARTVHGTLLTTTHSTETAPWTARTKYATFGFQQLRYVQYLQHRKAAQARYVTIDSNGDRREP